MTAKTLCLPLLLCFSLAGTVNAQEPLGATPAWTERGGALWTWYGFAVLGIGDLDDDGYDDLAVSAPLHDTTEANDLGAVYILRGSAQGPGPQPAQTLLGDETGSCFGEALAAGDFDGDGLPDLAVGAPDYGPGLGAMGRVFLYRGTADGLDPRPVYVDGPQAGSQFGCCLAAAGDVDGDGAVELLVGAPFFDGTNGTNVGHVTLLEWSAPSGGLVAIGTYEGTRPQSQTGFALSSLGDVDGDGFDDFGVGAPDISDAVHAGTAYVFAGGPSPSLSPVWSTDGLPGEQRGYALGALGDLDGDGYADFAIGAPFHDGTFVDEGCVYVVRGSASGPLAPVLGASGSGAQETLGRQISGPGDVDRDGVPDVLVSSGHEAAGNTGALYVYRATSSGLALTWSGLGQLVNAWRAGVLAGDANGDGYDDVLCGEWGADLDHVDEGQALVFLGRAGAEFTSYCLATSNSSGGPAWIDSAGFPSLGSGPLQLYASPVPNAPGLFLFGDQAWQLPFWDGWLCVGGQLHREPLTNPTNGVLLDSIDLAAAAPYVTPGTIWNFQAWFRDPLSVTGGNLSNALAVSISP